MQAEQDRPRQLETESRRDQLVQCARAERADGEARQRERSTLELERQGCIDAAADGGEQADRFRLQAPERKLEHARRRRVQPLRVVDREQHGSRLGGEPDDVQEPGRERALVGSLRPGLREQERRLERLSLRRRQPWQRLVEDAR